MPAGKVTLRVRNTGRLLHNVPFADQAIDRDIAPGDSATITVTMRKESLRFVCKNHSAAGMVGALVPAYPEGLRREPALLPGEIMASPLISREWIRHDWCLPYQEGQLDHVGRSPRC